MTPDAPPSKERLGFLDVARAVAALLVLTQHGLGQYIPGFTNWSLQYANVGRFGVILFLLVSGFIIPVSLEQGGSNARFWLRRFFRLFPAYWLSIAFAFGYCLCPGRRAEDPSWANVGDWLLNLTMLQGFFARPNIWGVFWTLQLELVIYATCSVLFACRLLSRADWIFGLTLAGYVALGLARPLLQGEPFGIGGQRFLYFAPLVGMVAQRYVAGRVKGRTLLALLAVFASSLPAVWWVNHALFPAEMTVVCLQETALSWGIAGGCFFLLLLARRRRMPVAGLRLGRISYSVYLLHPFVLMLLALTDWPAWAALPCLLAGTALLGELAFRFVEMPGITLGRAVERRWLPLRPDSAKLVASPSRHAA